MVQPKSWSGTPEILTQGFGRSYIDGWTADGSQLILDIAGPTRRASSGPGGSDIYLLSLAGDRTLRPFLETKFDEWQASVSPDGKWLAYTSNESGTYQIFVQPFPAGGGRWSISSEEAYGAKWAPDGKTLYYFTPGRLMAVPVQTAPMFVVGKPRILLNGYQQKLVDSGLMYDLSPDGSWFVTAQSKDDEHGLHQINLVVNWFGEIQRKVR